MESYKVFTVEGDIFAEGARVSAFKLGSGAVISAGLVGEKGRGRSLGVLPVEGLHDDAERVSCAALSESKASRPKLIASHTASSLDAAIIVFRTPIGYRGGNRHQGDILGRECIVCGATGSPVERPKSCPDCGSSSGPVLKFAPWPGQEICSGTIAQGAAGRMGSGAQMVALMPANVVFRLAITGRRPYTRYGYFDGKNVRLTSWEDRLIDETFPWPTGILMSKIIVTRHPALVDYLKEIGLATCDDKVIAHATPEQLEGRHVIGVLPLQLAALCEKVTVVPMRLPPELRGVELSIAQVREFACDPETFRVEKV